MFTWSPGLPDTDEICAPGILPIKAWSIPAAGTTGNLSALIDSTAIPNFLLEVAVPEPVTTTSLNALTSVTNCICKFEEDAAIDLFS